MKRNRLNNLALMLASGVALLLLAALAGAILRGH